MYSVFQINTVYQLFITINMRINNFPEGKVDLILTDHTPVLKSYIKNLSQSRLFNEIFYCKSLEFNKEFWETDNNQKKAFYDDYINKINNVDMMPHINYKKYEHLYVANLDAYTKFIYKKFPHLNIHLIEDGASICTNDWKSATQKWDYLGDFNQIYNSVEDAYLYSPELMCVDLGCELKKLPKINKNDKNIVNLYNNIFSYEKDFKLPRFVFVEEPFFADNIKNNDLELMKIISEEVGYNNFFIKTHPRNIVNRSYRLGLAKQKETPWPFELILMNSKNNDTEYITIDSGSLISSRAVFDDDIPTMFLYKIVEGPTRNIAAKEFIDYMDKFCELYSSNNLLVPRSKHELQIMLKHLKEQ